MLLIAGLILQHINSGLQGFYSVIQSKHSTAALAKFFHLHSASLFDKLNLILLVKCPCLSLH